MSDYKHVFRELRYEVIKVAFLNAFLTAAIVFFAANVLGTILKISFWYSLVPAGLVFFILFIRMMSRYTLRRLEEGNPEVRELLRTAADNQGTDSLLVHALFLELMQKLETVSAGVFISARSTTTKFLVIAALAFAPLLLVNYAPFMITGNPIEHLTWNDAVSGAKQALAPVIPIADATDRNLTGEKDILALGNDKLDITANAGQGSVDFSNPAAAQQKQFGYNDYPDQVDAQQTTAGSSLDTQDAALINRNCQLTGRCQ
jgi:hypothetical protein